MQQRAQIAAQRAKREQERHSGQLSRLNAELAVVTEDRYELQVILNHCYVPITVIAITQALQ